MMWDGETDETWIIKLDDIWWMIDDDGWWKAKNEIWRESWDTFAELAFSWEPVQSKNAEHSGGLAQDHQTFKTVLFFLNKGNCGFLSCESALAQLQRCCKLQVSLTTYSNNSRPFLRGYVLTASVDFFVIMLHLEAVEPTTQSLRKAERWP